MRPDTSHEPAPTALSVEGYRRELLQHNRPLRLHQGIWGGIAGIASYSATQAFAPEVLPSPALAMPLMCVAGLLIAELLFLPRRIAIYRLAASEHHDEVTREALKAGVGLSEVRIKDKL